MDFYTPITLPKPPFRFSHRDTIALMGSCFVENIGQILEEERFNVDINPFGTLYNPASIAAGLRRLLSGCPYGREELFERDGLFHSFDHHSRFSAASAAECLARVNERFVHAAGRLRQTDRLVITFGSAFVYTLKETGRIVGNCHKLPERAFERRRLEVEEIADDWIALIPELVAASPGIRLLFTVSPIRHWRDGAHENQLSKATLLLAIDRINQVFPERTAYFPAYEIMMDELRDYRFYADDMIHPAPLAVRHIWQRFSGSWLTDESLELLKEWKEIKKALEHKPFHPESEAYRRFINQTMLKIERINQKFPFFDTAKEKAILRTKGIR